MRAGISLTFQNLHDDMTDEDVYGLELRMAEMAEDVGLDSVWVVEHHFDGYAMCPDNFVVLSYLASRTASINLCTGAVILPWNDPLRVAEKAVMLDYLTSGRFILGLGRGLARMEYEGFSIPMSEARERFDEAAEMILRSLESGTFSGDGPFYKSPVVNLRPAPTRSFDGRIYSVGVSPESVKAAANIKAGLMAFIQSPMRDHAAAIGIYRDHYRSVHGSEAPPPVLAQQMVCHADASVAEEMAKKYIGQYYQSVVTHYDFAGEHFARTKGYQAYSDGAAAIRSRGVSAAALDYVNCQLWGTPDQILEKLRGYKAEVGDFESLAVPTVAQMSQAEALQSYELFAKEVVPELHRF